MRDLSKYFTVSEDGDIRMRPLGASVWDNTTPRITVVELHAWLQDLADCTWAEGDGQLDITDPSPSDLSADCCSTMGGTILTLNEPYNIDDHVAGYLNGGSIVQGDEIYIQPGGLPDKPLKRSLYNENYHEMTKVIEEERNRCR